MTNQRRLQRVVGGIAASIVALTAGAYVWLARDTGAPDDAYLRSDAVPGAPAGDGFAKLIALATDIEQLAPGTGRLQVPEAYDGSTRAVADALLDRDLVRQLPQRVAQVLDAPGFESAELTEVWPGVLDAVELLRLRMQRELLRGGREEAWRTAQLGLRLGRFLQEHTRSFRALSIAQAVQNTWVKSIEAAMDADQWSGAELGALVSLPEPAGVGERLLEGVRAEYADFQREAASQAATVSRLRRPVLYQPNRSRHAWLEAMRPAVTALRGQDLKGAHRALTSPALAADGAIRNAIGDSQVALSISGLVLPVRQAIDAMAQMSLLRLRAAMALYRVQEGRWPERLADLAGRQLAALPSDPWSAQAQELRYLPKEHRIYSVGPNQRDDQGRFNDEFSYRDGADDYGVRLPP